MTRLDAVVWGLTQYLFSLDTSARSANTLQMHKSSMPGRTKTFEDFTELKTGHNSNRGRARSLFGNNSGGEAYRIGQEGTTRRSSDLKFDTNL